MPSWLDRFCSSTGSANRGRVGHAETQSVLLRENGVVDNSAVSSSIRHYIDSIDTNARFIANFSAAAISALKFDLNCSRAVSSAIRSLLKSSLTVAVIERPPAPGLRHPYALDRLLANKQCIDGGRSTDLSYVSRPFSPPPRWRRKFAGCSKHP